MKKVNLNIGIKDLDGNTMDFSVKEQVHNMISVAVSKNPQRSMEIAKKIKEEGVIELLSEDEVLVTGSIKNANVSNFIKAQILEAFNVAEKK